MGGRINPIMLVRMKPAREKKTDIVILLRKWEVD